MAICKFARVDSDKEMVIQPQRLDRDLTFRSISDIFGIPKDQLLLALGLPNNREFVLELYYELFQRYGARIPGEVIDTDYSKVPPRVVRGPETVMSELGYTNVDVALIMIFTLEDHTQEFPIWSVPKRDFWVRLSPALANQLKSLVAIGPSADRCVKMIPLEYPSAEMADLSALRGTLESKLAPLAAERARHEQHRLYFEYARRIVLLNEQQWETRPRPYERQRPALEALRLLRNSMEELDRAAGRNSPASRAEREAARELLSYIGPTSRAAVPIMNVLEVLVEQPNAFPSEQVEDFLDEIRRTFVALSLSSLAEEFLTGHWIALLQDIVENISPEADAVLSEVGGPRFKAYWGGDWRDALTALRAPGDVSDDSPFKKLIDVGKKFDSVLGIVVGAMNETTMPLLLHRVARATKRAEEIGEYAQSLATCFLKVIAFAYVPHRITQQGQHLISGIDVDAWFKACADAIDVGDDAAIAALSKELRALQLGTSYKGRPLVRELSLLFSFASACAVANESEEATWTNCGKLLVEVLKVGEGISGLPFAYRTQWQLEEKLATPSGGRIGSHLGSIATVLAFVVTLGDTVNRWGRLSTGKRVGAALALASATASATAMLPFVAASARLAAGLSLVGFVLCAADFAWNLLDDLTTAGTQELFTKYFEHVMTNERGGPYRMSEVASQRLDTLRAFEAVVDADAFTKLRGPAGKRDYNGPGDVPTWHLANAMGFPAEHVAVMFGLREDEIAAAGIRFSPEYEPQDLAQPDSVTPAAGSIDRD